MFLPICHMHFAGLVCFYSIGYPFDKFNPTVCLTLQMKFLILAPMLRLA